MIRSPRSWMIGALLSALLLAAVPATRAQDASPAAGTPLTATDVCNQVMHAATPAAGFPDVTVTATFDLAFIDLMITHHERAIAMATIALERGERAEMVEFARHTIDVQQREIDQLKIWRELWYPGLPALTGEQAIAIFDQVAADSPGRGGVPGARELTAPPDIMGLCGANPGDFDLAFIERMSLHHSGALLLAHAAVTFAEHTEIQNFASAQIAALQTDIDTLYAWGLLWFPDATPGDID